MNESAKPRDALRRACVIVGSQAALASKLHVPSQRLTNWLNRDKQIPADYCPDIEDFTGGQVRCEELRPDVNWAVVRASSAKKGQSSRVSHA